MLVLLAAWLAYVALLTGGDRVILYDTFRDMAWAENMRAGRVWADPTLRDQPYWYAPANPWLAATLANLTGYSVIDIYGYNAFWFNGLIPILLYLLVRLIYDRTTALAALFTVFLGSYWWATHAAAGIPGIQGVTLNLVGLLCWHRCVTGVQRGRWGVSWLWPILTGVVLSLSTWHHPLCGIVLAGAIFLHAALNAALPAAALASPPHRPRRRFALFSRMLVVGAVSAALTLPLIVHMVKLPKANPIPLRFFAPELIERDFYAHAQAPLIVVCALVGVWFILRSSPRAVWIVTYALVGLVGQAAGYLAQRPSWNVPYLLPHEFQWHGQLAVGLCAAVGVAGMATQLARRSRPADATFKRVLWTVFLCAVATLPAAGGLVRASVYFVDLESLLARTSPLRDWIFSNTSLDDTFICPAETGYQIVSGLTGRKCIAVAPGHTNPAVDLGRRYADINTLLTTTERETFLHLAQSYDATHLLHAPASPEALPALLARYAAWPELSLEFVAPDGTVLAYRILPAMEEP